MLIFKESLGDLQNWFYGLSPVSAIGATPGCAIRGSRPKAGCGLFCPLGCVNGISHLLSGCDKCGGMSSKSRVLALVLLGALARTWSKLGQLRSSLKKWNKIHFSCDLSLYNRPKNSSVVLCCQCHQLSVLPQCCSEYLEFHLCGLSACEGFGFFGRCLAWEGWVSRCSPSAQELPGTGCAALSILVVIPLAHCLGCLGGWRGKPRACGLTYHGTFKTSKQ